MREMTASCAPEGRALACTPGTEWGGPPILLAGMIFALQRTLMRSTDHAALADLGGG